MPTCRAVGFGNRDVATCGKVSAAEKLVRHAVGQIGRPGCSRLTGIDPVPVAPPAVGVRAEVRAKKTRHEQPVRAFSMAGALLHFTRGHRGLSVDHRRSHR
jgi:hypothetical protein